MQLRRSDQLLLFGLLSNCRLSFASLARLSGLNRDTLRSRVLSFEESGVIGHYYIALFKSGVGISWYSELFCKGSFSDEQILSLKSIPEICSITQFDTTLWITINAVHITRGNEVLKEVKSILSNALSTHNLMVGVIISILLLGTIAIQLIRHFKQKKKVRLDDERKEREYLEKIAQEEQRAIDVDNERKEAVKRRAIEEKRRQERDRKLRKEKEYLRERTQTLIVFKRINGIHSMPTSGEFPRKVIQEATDRVESEQLEEKRIENIREAAREFYEKHSPTVQSNNYSSYDETDRRVWEEVRLAKLQQEKEENTPENKTLQDALLALKENDNSK